jgi:hypothetical protein
MPLTQEYVADLTTLTLRRATGKERYDALTFQATIEPSSSIPYFLLVVSYTAGDSMNPEGETRHEVVDLYGDYDIVCMVAQRIRDDIKADTYLARMRKEYDEKNLEIMFANGLSERRGYWPWKGHFEKVVEIAVYEVMLNGAPKKTVIYDRWSSQ